MKIDKNMMAKLAAMDDASLMASIRMIAAASGVDIGTVTFDQAQLAALRQAMLGATDDDIAHAKDILEGYRKE